VQSGTPLFALEELDGWESAEMVRRYAHLAPDHRRRLQNASVLCVPSTMKSWAQKRSQA
jgi:hypothetical protein